jgi:ferric-dicitrate binding protein FerR (iron transport regulator)
MMPTPDDEMGSPELASMTERVRLGVQRPSKADLDRGLSAIHAQFVTDRIRRRRFVRRSLLGGVAVMAALLVVQMGWISRQRFTAHAPPALAYKVEGGSVLDGGYLHEAGHAGVKLLFSEGTRFELMPGTRGRLRAVDEEGAHVAIENGTASFQVTQSKNRRWLVEVGPFLVKVKGTVFTVTWDPSSERFELILRHGRVVVSGPVSGGDLALRTGQRLVVSLAKAETVITEDLQEREANTAVGVLASSTAVPLTSPSAITADKDDGRSASTVKAPSLVTKVEGDRRWSAELASGRWDSILQNVERTGVEQILNTASSEDLVALADAARYRHRTELARAALLAQRRRFPESPRSLDAIFLLGRVEESNGNGIARAIARYDEYLTQAPAGTYAAEALGRKMTLTREANGPAAARPIAEEYLRRFPKGSYAGSARALLRSP